MRVLKSILSDSKKYYLDIKKKIEKNLAKLPKGSIKEREISGRKYYYLQQRKGNKVVHIYVGKNKPLSLVKQIKERENLQAELKKVNKALNMLKKS